MHRVDETPRRCIFGRPPNSRARILTGAALFPILWRLPLERSVAQEHAPSLPPAATTETDFEGEIAPLLQQKCLACHGAALESSGLRLDSREAMLKGGYSGAVVKPGNSAGSRLIHLVAGLDKERIMPMSGARLTAEQIGLLRAWIDRGAAWSEGPESEALAPVETPAVKSTHWAFIPPMRFAPPKVNNPGWVRNSIDRFVGAKLDAEDVAASPEAHRTTLIRRLSLDLIGLPPTPAEVEEFVSDDHPKAYENVVDRLLRSPHYGEKWARHWLDLARYGDSDGFETDAPRPHAWRYRHWVINALNQNMPFDRFTIEQLAGDLLPNATLEQRVATGFNRNTLTNREGGMDLEMLRVEQIIDRTNTLGTVWLG